MKNIIRIHMEKYIKEFLHELEVLKYSPSTINAYKDSLHRFDLVNDVTDIHTLSIEHVNRLREVMFEQKLSSSSVCLHLIAVRRFLRYLKEKDLVNVDFYSIKLPRREYVVRHFLSYEEIKKLLKEPSKKTFRGVRDKALIELFFSTGLRLSELVSLNVDQVKFDTREIPLKGKGGRARLVFLSESTCLSLKNYLSQRDDKEPALFVTYRNGVKRLTARPIQRLVKKYIANAGLPPTTSVHSLRHSFASFLLNQGADLRVIQELLGHKNISTTQIYTHVTNEKLRSEHQKYYDNSI